MPTLPIITAQAKLQCAFPNILTAKVEQDILNWPQDQNGTKQNDYYILRLPPASRFLL